MLEWEAHFFSLGYRLEYIKSISYWEYLELIKGMVDVQKKSSGKSGKYFASGGELTDTHRQMIKNRKKLHG